MQTFEKSMTILMNKFSNFGQSIKDKKTTYIYNNKKYNINSIDYIYLVQQTLLIISKNYQYTSIDNSIYLDIFQNMLHKKIKRDTIDYGRIISVKKENENIFIREDSKKEQGFNILNTEKKYSVEFKEFAMKILQELINLDKKFLCFICHVKYKTENHSELLFFQIYKKKLYIINYDPYILGIKGENNEMYIFLKLLEKFFNAILTKYNIGDVQIVNKTELSFEHNNKKYGGLQRITNNLKHVYGNTGSPSTGICEIFSLFMLYYVVYINYSIKNTFLCSDLIKNIEQYIFLNFLNSGKMEYFSEIIINFANHITDNYYIYMTEQISIDNKLTSRKFQEKIKYVFDFLFSELTQKLSIHNEKLDFKNLRSSGYTCKEDIECSSYKCLNNHCYIDEKGVDPEDIRSVGNPCLYNIQCRSGDCRDYVCIGEDNHEKEDNYDTCYDPDEIIEYDINAEILDNQNNDEYLNM